MSTDDVSNDVSTASPSLQSGDLTSLVFKVIYSIIGIVGVLDNCLVLMIFILFVKITDKVLQNCAGLSLKSLERTQAYEPIQCHVASVISCYSLPSLPVSRGRFTFPVYKSHLTQTGFVR